MPAGRSRKADSAEEAARRAPAIAHPEEVSRNRKACSSAGENPAIRSFRGRHAGGRLLVLGNGPSCRMYNLAANCPTIGLNQAWRFHACDYLCMGDKKQCEMFAAGSGRALHLFTRESGPDGAILLQSHNGEMRKRFSFDLETDGIYQNNTIASFGIQLATYMLGEEGTIYLLGIDCAGPSYDGTSIPPIKFTRQRETLGYISGVLEYARPKIKVFDLSPISETLVFDRMAFHDAFP